MVDQAQTQWTAESILEFLRTHHADLQALGVLKIGLFGSYARGDQQPGSDIDFLFSSENLTWESWMDVWNFLEAGLGVKIDLVPEKDLRPELRETVLNEVLYVETI